MPASIVSAPDILPKRMASGARVRTLLDTGASQGRLVRSLVDIPPDGYFAGASGPGGELWFVISGTLWLELGPEAEAGAGPELGDGPPPEFHDHPQPGGRDGPGIQIGRHQAARMPADTTYRLYTAGADPVLLDTVILPARASADNTRMLVSDPRDCAVEVTGDRRFRVLFGPGRGCAGATQFLGEIPPGRAPEHSHAYDELVLVLEGRGIAHAGDTDHPLAPGTCVHLPPGQRHCLENTGRQTLVVLGVFHPGGSPAAKQTTASR